MVDKKSLRILFSHFGILDGSGCSRSLPLAYGLASLNHKVIFITCQPKGFKFPYRKEERKNILILAFPDFVPKTFLKAGFGILSTILKVIYSIFHCFDIVHSDSGHRPSSGIPCIVNRLIYKSIYISEWWDYFGKGGKYDEMPPLKKLFLGNYDNWAEIFNKKIADGVVTLSQFTKERAFFYGIKERALTIIHGGSDVHNIHFHENTSLRKKFGIDPKCLLFGFTGITLEEVNDIIPFIKAVNNLKDNFNIKWFTTGLKLNEDISGRLNIGNDLYEFGWINYWEYSDLLSCADAFLLLLKQNLQNKARFPNKLGDYLAAGRLILTNGYGEVNNYISKFSDCFIKVNWNVNEIQNTIIELFTSKDILFERRKKIREIAEQYNSWMTKSIELERFYLQILNNNELN